MSRSRSESFGNKSLSSGDLIIVENHFYSPSPSSLDESKEEYEKAIQNGISVGEIFGEEEPATVIKRRIRNTWNNAKYNNTVSRWVLKQRSSFDDDQPVWLLGKMYWWKSDRKLSLPNRFDSAPVDEAYRAFLADFSSRIWLTYRKDFSKLNGCRLRSDCGWGCMLRCGQMLLAQALVCHILGRDWIQCQDRDDPSKRKYHRQIVEWFIDCPRRPFSLHRLVEMGLAYGKRGGDWYGPASTAMILRDALINRQISNSENSIVENLAIFVATDGVIYLDELERSVKYPGGKRDDLDKATGEKVGVTFVLDNSLFLVVPLRLGADRCNQVYVYHLKTVLSLKTCVGIIGGRPKHSMYFVGWQRDSLIYLDPHYCHDAVETERITEAALQTYHCKWPRKLPFTDMDPSCAVGFYLRAGTNMDDFLSDLTDIVEYKEGNHQVKYPLFSVMKQKPVFEGRRRTESLAEENEFSGAVIVGRGRRSRSSSLAALKRDYVFI